MKKHSVGACLLVIAALSGCSDQVRYGDASAQEACRADVDCQDQRRCVDGVCKGDDLDAGDGPDSGDRPDATDDGGGPDDVGEDASADAGGPVGPVNFELFNNGEVPTYVSAFDQGIEIFDEAGQHVRLDAFCRAQCEDFCEEIQCEPPEPQAIQVLPGAARQRVWDGEFIGEGSCVDSRGEEIMCDAPRQARPGRYRVRVCHSPLLDGGAQRFVRRIADDRLVMTEPQRPMECVEQEFELIGRAQTVRVGLDPRLAEPKALGYCGQAWRHDQAAFVWVEEETPARFTEASSVRLTVGPGPTEVSTQRCLRRSSLRAEVRPDSREVILFGKGFRATQPCETFGDERFTFELPGLAPGRWTAWSMTLGGFQPPPFEFEVERCVACQACPEAPLTPLGGMCNNDCACAVEGAVCADGACQLSCLEADDCPSGLACGGRGEGPLAGAGKCDVPRGRACAFERDCAPGLSCEEDLPQARCERWEDLRGLDAGNGLGFHCGCDAECPGNQSCVAFEFNFTQGQCAIQCRDGRDCPQGWSCLGETSSGLEGICIPRP